MPKPNTPAAAVRLSDGQHWVEVQRGEVTAIGCVATSDGADIPAGGDAVLSDDYHIGHRALRQLCERLSDPFAAFDVPLRIEGTALQRAVYTALLNIPVGETRTYTQLAAAVGRPTACRAVAQACARNRHAFIVPCHRIVRSDGALGGYAWGIERKRALLALEQQSAQQARAADAKTA